MSNEKELYSIQEAAEYLGVSRVRIWKLVKEGVLITIKDSLDSRKSLISKEQLDKLKKTSSKTFNS